MKIQSVEAIPLTATFKSTFRFGTTDRTTSPNVVVIIRTDEGVAGYGEACPVPAFTGESQKSIVELVEQRVAPVLIGRDASVRVPLLDAVGKVLKFAPFTLAAVDTALLDLVGRSRNLPVHALLGGAFRDRVEVHGSVGWNEDPAKMVDIAREQAGTYGWLKLYAGRGELGADLDRLQAVRDAVGPETGLFVDVNTMWSPSDLVRALPRVEEIGLSMLEQPLPTACAALQPQLVGARPVDIAADEAVRTVGDAAAVVANRSATVINVGHSKLGGPTAALQAAHIAAASGVGVMVGSVIEMGIATAMGLHLAAALPRLAYPSYLMGPLKYAQQITDQQIDVVDGHVAVPAGPGLGITVDEAELRRLDARTQP
ncbi:mandelate racemase/muconate lactonizing enzyme family protein [Arthrobacter sp. AZCC_0090]|uniref:mandelate racemase/muconate lactonizing enzyme family protein n=1 Tax=Arthrobacter sp. AZCC_0090 TaxID=2735881 RepID=UPI00160A1CCF|nr:enolase C-terminal domain-like protein [Arthrobacter sp. AZCC_0090]MBB6405149.1 muconate cycloisomerase [Arthrobacter sp. AZCC_0090]